MEKLPVYAKIARDITNKILQGEFKEGDLLKGRSLLASTYKVSPETIRKALNILEEQKIVENKHGVGCFVDSVAYAKQFKDSWDNVETISRNQEALNNILDKIQNIHDELKEAIDDFVTNVRFQVGETIDFKKVTINNGCWLVNKTIGDVYFYNYTEATIVAIKNGEELIASPGPDYIFKEGDTVIFVCKDELTYPRVLSFVIKGIEE